MKPGEVTEYDGDGGRGTKPPSIYDYLQSQKAEKELARALPRGRNVQRYISGLVTTLAMQKTGSLILQATPASILKCAIQSAQLGLDIDAKGHCFIVPFRNNKAGTVEAVIVPGWKGYVSKARESSKVNSIWIEAVYSCDQFRVVKGTDPKIEHYPDVSHADYGKDQKITHFYACVKLQTGEIEFEVMTRAQVEAINTHSDIWAKHFGEMGKKTCWLRLAKKLQLPEVSGLLAYDESMDSKLSQEGPAPDAIDEKAVKSQVRTFAKKLGWDKGAFAAYLSARGYAAWDSMTAAQKVSVSYDLEKRAGEKK